METFIHFVRNVTFIYTKVFHPQPFHPLPNRSSFHYNFLNNYKPLLKYPLFIDLSPIDSSNIECVIIPLPLALQLHSLPHPQLLVEMNSVNKSSKPI